MVVLTALVGFVMGVARPRPAAMPLLVALAGHRPGGRRRRARSTWCSSGDTDALHAAHAQPAAAPPAACALSRPSPSAWRLTVVGLAGPALPGSGPLPAAVALVTWATYLFCYTPLKTRTSLSTIVGALPGALPPVIGWAAARGQPRSAAPSCSSRSCSSGRSRTSWPSPGSTARTTRAAACPMLPVLDPAGRMTGRQAVANSVRPTAREPDADGRRG